MSEPAPRSASPSRELSPSDPLRVVFMGTPMFAAVILKALIDAKHANVAAVFTQPDRPASRGKKLKVPETKALAETFGIPVHQPGNFVNTPEGNDAMELLASYKPQVLVVAAYGLILPQRVLDIPTLMPINVHASLLPRYRGAAPIQRSIMDGESVTGITIMRMEAGLDTGPILMQRAVGIGIEDTAAILEQELASVGAELLLQALDRLRIGKLHSVPQDPQQSTYAPKLFKDEARLDFSMRATALHANIRGLTPWPGATLTLCRPGKPDLPVLVKPGFIVLATGDLSARIENLSSATSCGSITGVQQDALLVTCADGWYAFPELQPTGKRSMHASAFYNGYLAGNPGAFFRCPPKS